MVTKMVKAINCDLCGREDAEHYRLVKLDPRSTVNVDMCADCATPLDPMFSAGRVDGRAAKKRTVTPLDEITARKRTPAKKATSRKK